MARAGYRFVPFDDRHPPRIVRPPISFDELKLDEPNGGGSVSGTLEVTWVAETPVCIGVEGSNGIEPFEIQRLGCLPGASLRGMVRNVMEIAGFCHLGPINDHRHFGFRNVTDAVNYIPRVQNIKAGWLKYDSSSERWSLTAADGDIVLVQFDDILNRMVTHANQQPPSLADWRELEIHDKRDRLSKHALSLLQKQKLTINNVTRAVYLVVGGATAAPGPHPRAHEVYIGPPSTLQKNTHQLHDKFMDLFNRINANPGRDTPEPIGAWRYWLSQKAPNSPQAKWIRSTGPSHLPCGIPGIPVFYCGDPPNGTDSFDPKTSDFVMGLSRVIKIPYRESVGDVAGRLYGRHYGPPTPYRVPLLRDNFDLARAIFGWVDDSKDDDDAQALAGRVAFSPAFSNCHPQRVGPFDFVLGPPRESFYPFYLNGDYHGGGGEPVGRKRYPVRIKLNNPNLPNQNVATQSRVSFHACRTSYTGRIRVHNLHPVELAAFVWCLTFGKLQGPWRHAIGRAKGFGYGRLHLQSLAWTRSPKIVGRVEREQWNASTISGVWSPCDWDQLAGLFEDWMSDTGQLGCTFTDTEPIQRLRAYADPAVGDKNSTELTYPSVEDFRGITTRVDDGENW